MLGHDDIILPNKIAEQVSIFEQADEKVAVVFSDVNVIDGKSEIIEHSYLEEHGYNEFNFTDIDITAELLKFNFIPAISVLLRTSAVKKIGQYDAAFEVEDLYMWLKLSTDYKFIFYNSITAQYRRTSNSMMHSINSNIKVLNSVLYLRETYINKNDIWNKIINKGIIQSAPTIYRYNKTNGKYWLKKRLMYDKSLKSYMYRIMSFLNIGYFWK